MRLELKIDELLTRLTNVADKQDGSPDLEPSRPPAESIESTSPPITVHDLEISSYHELIEDGGRPACSIQELSHILAEPITRYKAVLPWLSDDPGSEIGAGEIKTVFSRQFTRWWGFHKSKWGNRGFDDSEGLSAFLEASRRRYEGMGAKAMVSAPSFDETIQRQWQRISASRQLPDGQAFSAYRDAVQIRLASHHFTQPLQLKKNIHQQTVWTNWLEYLSYEQWCLEMLTATVESLEQQYHQSWRRLLRTMEPNSNNAVSSSAASNSTQTRQRRPGAKIVNLAKELETAQAARDASNKIIYDFIGETKPYTHAQTAACYQRHRVDWAIKEARLMETEMSQQSKMTKNNTKIDTNESKKRRRDDDEISPKSQPKRIKRGENAVSGATPDKLHTRRSIRHSRLNDKAPLQIGV